MDPQEDSTTQQTTTALVVSIDPSQLLTLCQKIRENMSDLGKSIRLAQVRLKTLSYVRDELVGGEDEASLYCFDDLFAICNLSQLLVQQLDELQSKMASSNNTLNVVDYQIASQQLMFFTNEWYGNLIPQFNKTFEIVNQLDVGFGSTANATVGRQTRDGTTTTRLSDALLRLRQSMRENEKLIALIASNVEYTKTVVDAIHDSLQVTKLGLGASEKNITTALDLTKPMSTRFKLLIVSTILTVLVLLTYLYLVFVR